MTRASGLGALLLVAGCSGAALPSDLQRAQALELGHDDAGALAAWRAIREGCANPDARPRGDCGLAAIREAQLLERLARDDEAAAAWEALPQRTREPPQAALALYRAAALADRRGDRSRAESFAWRCLEQYPDESSAERAVDLLLRLATDGGDAMSAIARFDRGALRLQAREVADNLLFAAAHLAEPRDPLAALARFDDLPLRHPSSPLADDPLWRSMEILRRRGDFPGAIERLRRITRTRRPALVTGSYNALLLDDAQLEIGRLYRDGLQDPEGALRELLIVADDYPESTLRDDALLEAAEASLARHTPPTGDDRRQACALLQRLRRQFPDSNRRPAAGERARQLACDPGG